MAVSPFEHADEAWAALREISEERGSNVLSDPVLLAGLLADMLPSAASAVRIMVTAAEDRVAATILDYINQGLSADDAIRMAAQAFAKTSMLTPDVCRWVANAFAAACGFAPDPVRGPVITSPAGSGPERLAEVTTSANGDTIDAAARLEHDAERQAPTETAGVLKAVPLPRIQQPSGKKPVRVQQAIRPVVPSRQRSRRPLYLTLTITIVIATAAGLFTWTRLVHHRPALLPVLAPTGLADDGSTFTSASFNWSQPSRGPMPGRYIILEDGAAVASLPGTVTVFQATGLTPNTAYVFQVVAVRKRRHSVESLGLAVRTKATPPAAVGILSGTWMVSYSHVSWSGLTFTPHLSSDLWQTSPRCGDGRCSVTLKGQFQGWQFDTSAILRRNGSTYTGTVTETGYLSCSTTNIKELSYLTIRLRVVKADLRESSQWDAVSWSGRLSLYVPAGTCRAQEITADIHGS